jgi:hypothetical protein
MKLYFSAMQGTRKGSDFGHGSSEIKKCALSYLLNTMLEILRKFKVDTSQTQISPTSFTFTLFY